MDFLKEILPIIISTVFIALAVPLGKLAGKYLKKIISNIDNEILNNLAHVGVRWASEHLGKGMGLGQRKHKMVFDFIKDKVNLPDDLINSAIKAEVIMLREIREAMGNGASSDIEPLKPVSGQKNTSK